MSNLKKGQQVPLIKVEPNVKDSRLSKIGMKSVKAIEVEEIIPTPIEIEVKRAPLKKKKALGKRESVKKRIGIIKKGVEAKKAENRKSGVVKVVKVKFDATSQPLVLVRRKAGRPKMSDKQKLIAKIIRDGKKIDKVISMKQAEVIYYKIKEAARVKSAADTSFWFKSVKKMPDGVCKQMLILMAVIAIIRGKLGMPKNINQYKDRSIEMAQVQTLNASGYFTVVFAGLPLWITHNTALASAITNYGLHNGTGSTALIAAAKVNVKASLNLFMAYINGLAAANQSLAVSIIETALCVVITKNPPKVIDFQYKMGPGTGNIRLISTAVKINGKRVTGTYEFQYGYMVAGVIVWTSLDSQKNCKVLLKGLATGVTTYFRKRSSTTKGGMSAWCAPINTTVE